jgi:hypothetical protein
MRVANGVALGCPLLLPVHTVNCVQILKVGPGPCMGKLMVNDKIRTINSKADLSHDEMVRIITGGVSTDMEVERVIAAAHPTGADPGLSDKPPTLPTPPPPTLPTHTPKVLPTPKQPLETAAPPTLTRRTSPPPPGRRSGSGRRLPTPPLETTGQQPPPPRPQRRSGLPQPPAPTML